MCSSVLPSWPVRDHCPVSLVRDVYLESTPSINIGIQLIKRWLGPHIMRGRLPYLCMLRCQNSVMEIEKWSYCAHVNTHTYKYVHVIHSQLQVHDCPQQRCPSLSGYPHVLRQYLCGAALNYSPQPSFASALAYHYCSYHLPWSVLYKQPTVRLWFCRLTHSHGSGL